LSRSHSAVLVVFLQVALRLWPPLFWIEIEREIRKERVTVGIDSVRAYYKGY
jgi:hypothetical protein